MDKRARVKSKVSSDINVTPMADIMLVLLIIFMITTPLLQSGITVNLPKAKYPLDAPEAQKNTAVVIALDDKGRLFLSKTPKSDSELSDYLAARFSEGEIDKTVYLKGDMKVPYGRVVEIVNCCRKAGVDKIGLMAEKED